MVHWGFPLLMARSAMAHIACFKHSNTGGQYPHTYTFMKRLLLSDAALPRTNIILGHNGNFYHLMFFLS
ncbi:hypothetical protein BDN70DRAFT_870649 [Pholiota conissans]|uniref:Secreted protein n=1 Tax=Pholiota conissans TaxID=109636 RepID=A0A9P5ZH47_9AGAR|nr:hypothetical protein BDN70DRAFT_870649 [Pholiota conissans]